MVSNNDFDNYKRPTTTLTRMRYRGPIESYKLNRNIYDVTSDLKILKNKFDNLSNILYKHINETINGNDEKIIIVNNNTKLTVKENIPTHIINHSIHYMLSKEEN